MNRLAMKLVVLSPSLLTVMAGAAIAPGLEKTQQAFPAIDSTLIQMILTIPVFVGFLFTLVAGTLSLFIKKKTILLIGVVFYLIGGVGGFFLSDFTLVLIFRAILGVGVGLMLPISTSIMGDYYEGSVKSQMMSFSASASQLGGIIGMVFTGWLVGFGWQFTYFVYLMGIPVLFLLLFVLPPKDVQKSTKQKGIKIPVGVYLATFLGFLVGMIFYVLPTNLSFYLERSGIAQGALSGFVMSLMTFGAFAIGLLLPLLHQAIKRLTIPLGIFLGIVGFVGLYFSTEPVLASIATLIFGVGFGIVNASVMIKTSELADQKSQGLAMSLLGGGFSLGMFATPLMTAALGAIMNDTSTKTIFFVMALFCSLCLLVSIMYILRPLEALESPKDED